MVTTEIVLPELGTGASEGELVAWLVDPGDRVAAEQTVAEVETDKSLIEVPAPASGAITELRVEAGATVAEGDVLALMEADESEASQGAEGAAAGSEERAAAEADDAPTGAEGEAAPSPEESPAVASGRVFAPPRVRRLARDLSVDITAVEGTGDGGAITESDVRAAAEKRSASDAESTAGPRAFTGGTSVTARRGDDSPRDLSPRRSAVRRREGGADPLADRVEPDPESDPTPAPREPPNGTDATVSVVDSASGDSTPDDSESADSASAHSASDATPSAIAPPETGAAGPQTTHHDTVDVTAMRGARERLAAAGVADGAVTDLAFAVAAVAAALEAVPALNGPLEDGEIDRRRDVNVAIAIPTDDGLVAPVVVDANDAPLPALAREIAELVERAREGSLSSPETADATFTVTDFGALGGTYATPSVAATGTAVLALGEIRERPRIHDGEVTARAVLPLSAAVDARAVDGAAAAQLLTEVRRYLNTPELLLIE